MFNLPLLSIAIFLPLVGALVILAMRHNNTHDNARIVGLITTVATAIIAVVIFIQFNTSSIGFQFVENYRLSSITYHVGVDGLSMLLMLLTAILMPIVMLAQWRYVHIRINSYISYFLVLETFIMGSFCALDTILFYVFFEGVLIPMFLIIGIWGGSQRVYAATKFFLYTLLGSVLMLMVLIIMYTITKTTSIPELMVYDFDQQWQLWLWLGLLASFAVKMPMWPVHTWLPDAHVEAPTAGSVILAGVLLKMGGYGFFRFSLSMLPQASIAFTPLMLTLSIIAVIYTSLIAFVQQDMKKLVAYSSIAHMAYVTFGAFSGSLQGLQGAFFQMISHGLISAGLFLCIGVLYDRCHTRDIAAYGGIAKIMPLYATMFLILIFGAIGLPGTMGFVGEILVMISAVNVNGIMAILMVTGIVLSAAYSLYLYRRVMFGKVEVAALKKLKDLTPLETLTLLPLVILIIALGIYPQPLLTVAEPALVSILKRYSPQLTTAQELFLTMNKISEYALIFPELLIILAALYILLWGTFFKEQRHVKAMNISIVIILVTACGCTFLNNSGGLYKIFSEQLVINDFTQIFKRFILMGTAAILFMSHNYFEAEYIHKYEYGVLALLATVGMMITVSAHDLMALIMGLELLSLSLYIMIACHRDNALSSEAALKYFILSSLATALILYGCSFIYGYCGSTSFSDISTVLHATNTWALGLKSGVLLMLVGIAFKISLAPFHMWTPDVYQGSPTPTTIFIGAITKVASIAVIVRLLHDVFSPLSATYKPFMAALAVISMIVGTFAALSQTSLRRMLGYSTVSHMGYAMIGLIAGHLQGIQSTIIYSVLYMIMSITVFSGVLCLRQQDKIVDDISRLAGLADDRPFVAAVIAISLFSLAGIPPLAGFFAKFTVFAAAVQQGYYYLAVIGVLTSVVGAAYYIKIIKIMYFDQPHEASVALHLEAKLPRSTSFIMILGIIIILGYIIESSWLVDSSVKATKALCIGS